jgi:SAM-dependent methyltransferase
MTIREIQSRLDVIEQNSSLYEDTNFENRLAAMDFLGFQITDAIAQLPQAARAGLESRAERITSGFEEIDDNLFERLRSDIRAGKFRGAEFRRMTANYVDLEADVLSRHPGAYDNLDHFINGLLNYKTMPAQTMNLQPGMVYYQKTPARMMFGLAQKKHFAQDDIFVDLGSGLGQAALLIHLLTGVTVQGVEIEPAFSDYAKARTAELMLPRVTFINIDARKADISKGTVFFMFTPFTGSLLEEVLGRLREESLLRKIDIITYGPCTPEVAGRDWLKPSSPPWKDEIYDFGSFTSL